jgi:hypothetical protein
MNSTEVLSLLIRTLISAVGVAPALLPDTLPYAPDSLYPPPPGKIPGIHFSWKLSRPQGHIAAGRISPIHRDSIPRLSDL